MKSKFKMGDRVAAYSLAGKNVGVIVQIDSSGFIHIKEDCVVTRWHPKQCRRLIKTEEISNKLGIV